MDKKNKDENAKNPDWKVPMDLPSVKPEDYDKSIDSSRGSANSDTEDGAKGFSPQLSGHSKAAHSHTTSFDVEDARYSENAAKAGQEKEQPGQDEGRMAQPTTSAAGRLTK
jgi:hypothetical protein